MKQLLEIRTIPIAMEFKLTRARYEMSTEQPRVDVSRQRGGLSITQKAPQMMMDSVDMRASMGMPTVLRASREQGQAGLAAATEATGNYAMEGNQLMQGRLNADAVPRMIEQRLQAATAVETVLSFTPSVPMNISVEPGNLDMQYQMDRLSFNWRVSHEPQMDYIPANLEFSVKQYPRLEIKYVGGPNYAPPSSDPNYQPGPFTAVA